MKITLVTVCRNAADVIETAVVSVLRQTWTNVELILVVGASQDDTRSIAERLSVRHPSTVRCVFEPALTIYEALNKGIGMATGEIVGLLHADDAMSSDGVLARVVGAFGSDDGLQAVYGDVRFVSKRADVSLEALRAERTVRRYSAKRWHPWMLQWGFMPPHPSLYVRRACFERLGGYATDYAIAADYALMIRYLRTAEVKAEYLPMTFVDMRMGGLSTKGVKSTLLLNREIVRANRECGYFCCLPMLLPKYAFKVWEFVVPTIWALFSRQGVGK